MQPNFVGQFTQSEATAAQRTFTFYAPDATDGFTAELALNYEAAASDVLVSKNGAAFANSTGTVTEVANGVYKYEIATAELDTIGTVVFQFVKAAARTVFAQAQVVLLDHNIATVGPTAGSIVAASFGAGAIDAAAIANGAIDAATFAAAAIDAAAIATDAFGDLELAADAVSAIQNGLATTAAVAALTATRDVNNVFIDMGLMNANESTAGFGLEQMATGVITLTGTWDGATVTVQVCADPSATVPVWKTYGTPATADGTVALTGPLKAVRCTMSSAGAGSTVTASLAIRKY